MECVKWTVECEEWGMKSGILRVVSEKWNMKSGIWRVVCEECNVKMEYNKQI